MQVLEAEDKRTGARERLEGPARRPEELFVRRRRLGRVHQAAEECDHFAAARVVRQRRLNRIFATELAEYLRQRPEGNPSSVGEATACGSRRAVFESRAELGREPRLSDSGRA